MNRRGFHSDTLARSAGTLLNPLRDLVALSQVPLLRCSRPAMATVFELLLPIGTSDAAVIAHDVFDLIDELEAQLTVYRDDSEVSQLNRRAATEEVVLESRLFELVRLAAQLTAQTWGAFDVTAGPLIKTWGFFHRQGRMPTPSERQEALMRVGMRHVALNAERRSARFRRPGVEMNFGSIGKGFALDCAAERLIGYGLDSALLHGGGSSVRAIGHQPGEPRGWPVAIRHPERVDERLALVYLRDRAMGTSAATYQHFTYNNKRMGHVLDPRTGRPAEGIASATALAPTAAEADALATAFYVLGIEKTRLFCAGRPEVGAVLMPDGDETPIIVNLTSDVVSLPTFPRRPARTD